MPRTFTTVTGPVFLASGEVPKNGKIAFTLSTWDAEVGEALYVAGPFVQPLDENGDFSLNLFSSTAGENSSVYYISIIYEDISGEMKEETIGIIAISGAGPVKISDLEIIPSWTPTGLDVLAQILATETVVLGYRDEAAASAASVLASEIAASDSAAAAEASRVQTDAMLDAFDDRYLGTKASEPALDNDGAALQPGTIYFNSTSNDMWVYTGSVWSLFDPGVTATLASIGVLGTAAGKIAYTTGVNTWAETNLTAFGRDIIGAVDNAALLTAAGLGAAANKAISANDDFAVNPSDLAVRSVIQTRIAAAIAAIPTPSSGWEVFDGSGGVTPIWDLTRDGAIASIESPVYENGYEYGWLVHALRNNSSNLTIALYQETTGSYSTILTMLSSLAANTPLYGPIEIVLPRKDLTFFTVKPAVHTGTGNTTLQAMPVSVGTAQKIGKSKISSTGGSFNLGSAYAIRRRTGLI